MLSCRIAQLRKSIRMNQLQLAKKLHLSPSTIGMYEQGRRTPSVETLIQLASLFNVSLDYLITGCEYTSKAEGPNAFVVPPACPCCKCCRR